MSEPYYYLSGFIGNQPRIQALDFSCVTAGTESYFYAKKGSGVIDLASLSSVIQASSSTQKIGFIGAGNYHSVSAILPDPAGGKFAASFDATSNAAIQTKVDEGTFLAGYLSEGDPATTLDGSKFDFFARCVYGRFAAC